MLPAVPTSTTHEDLRIGPGENRSRSLPGSFPSVSPSQVQATARTAAQCWNLSPAFFRFALILVISIGIPVTAESATADRTICPPPSRCEPSILSIG